MFHSYARSVDNCVRNEILRKVIKWDNNIHVKPLHGRNIWRKQFRFEFFMQILSSDGIHQLSEILLICEFKMITVRCNFKFIGWVRNFIGYKFLETKSILYY